MVAEEHADTSRQIELRGLLDSRRNTLAAVREIIEEAAADKQAAAGSDRQKVGDFYRTYMDTAGRKQSRHRTDSGCWML